MIEKPRSARRKGSGALDSCFGLVSPHQPFPYLRAPRVIKVHSSGQYGATYNNTRYCSSAYQAHKIRMGAE